MNERVREFLIPWGKINTKHFFIITLIIISIGFYAYSTHNDVNLRAMQPLNTLQFIGDKPHFALTCYTNQSIRSGLKTLDEDRVPRNASFFFIETSCHENLLELSARQSCSVESVARLNPKSAVYVLVPSTVRQLSLSFRARKLFSYKNVRIRHLNMSKYFEGSPLSNWNWEGHLMTSLWPHSHVSDVLRYLTLWKFGGTYFDTDVILERPFNYTNFAGAESSEDVGSAVLSISQGHSLSGMILNDLYNDFRGDVWPHNGPGVMKRSLMTLCGVEKPIEMTQEKCGSFKVLPSQDIYPIHWQEWERFFTMDPLEARETMETIKNSTTVHLWNFLSSEKSAKVGSTQPYVRIARKFCPKIYSTLKSTF